jgi:hypothetical protein
MATSTAKRTAMYERIGRHGKQLLAIFPNAIERDPVKLCKKLRKLEIAANKLATDNCNGDGDYQQNNEYLGKIEDTVSHLLGIKSATNEPLYLNTDPRGYALKIDDAYMEANNIDLHRDWGGYGIIAPDLSDV